MKKFNYMLYALLMGMASTTIAIEEGVDIDSTRRENQEAPTLMQHPVDMRTTNPTVMNDAPQESSSSSSVTDTAHDDATTGVNLDADNSSHQWKEAQRPNRISGDEVSRRINEAQEEYRREAQRVHAEMRANRPWHKVIADFVRESWHKLMDAFAHIHSKMPWAKKEEMVKKTILESLSPEERQVALRVLKETQQEQQERFKKYYDQKRRDNNAATKIQSAWRGRQGREVARQARASRNARNKALQGLKYPDLARKAPKLGDLMNKMNRSDQEHVVREINKMLKGKSRNVRTANKVAKQMQQRGLNVRSNNGQLAFAS